MHRSSNLPPLELEALKATHKLKVFDSPYEALFKSITNTAKEVFKAPIALISFMDVDSKWFKPNMGLDGKHELPIELAFCWHTINSDGVFFVQDASQDDRFKDNPLVLGEPYIRFFAGAPITMPLGEKVGSLCVIDTTPNHLYDYKKATLEGLAKSISQALTIRDIHSRMVLDKSDLALAFKSPLLS